MKYQDFLQKKVLSVNEDDKQYGASTSGGEIDALLGTAAGAMILFMRELKRYTMLKTSYKKAYETQKKQEQINLLSEEKMSIAGKLAEEDFEENFKKKKEQATKNAPPEKKEMIRNTMDKNKDQMKQALKDKMTARLNALKEQNKPKLKKAQDQVNEIINDNKLNIAVLSSKWQQEKAEIDGEINAKYILENAAKLSALRGGNVNLFSKESLAKIEQRAKEDAAQAKADAQKRVQEKKDAYQKEQQRFDEKLKSGSEEEKAAAADLKDYMDKFQTFIKAAEALNSKLANESEDYSFDFDSYFKILEDTVVEAEGDDPLKAEKDAVKQASKDMNAAFKKLSGPKLAKAMGISKEEGENYLTELKNDKKAAVEDLEMGEHAQEDAEEGEESELEKAKKEKFTEQEPADYEDDPTKYETREVDDGTGKKVKVYRKAEDGGGQNDEAKIKDLVDNQGYTKGEPTEEDRQKPGFKEQKLKDKDGKEVTLWTADKSQSQNDEEKIKDLVDNQGYTKGEPSEEDRQKPGFKEQKLKDKDGKEVTLWTADKSQPGGNKTPLTPEKKAELQKNIEKYTKQLDGASPEKKEKIEKAIKKWQQQLDDSSESTSYNLYSEMMAEMRALDEELNSSVKPASSIVTFSQWMANKQ